MTEIGPVSGESDTAATSTAITGESGQTVVGTTNGKEFASGIVATLIAFLGGLVLAISDDKITAVEWVTISLNTVVGAAAGFGITYVVPTRIR